jgi:hypothetical protein
MLSAFGGSPPPGALVKANLRRDRRQSVSSSERCFSTFRKRAGSSMRPASGRPT